MLNYRQKAQNILLPFSLSMLLLVLAPGLANSGHCQTQTGREATIDSLIRVNRINEKTILITFGADAVTAINTRDGIVMIDAGISTGLTSRYKKRIEAEFPSSGFLYVINTHGHHDHTRGNEVFSEAKIIGHKNAIEEIARQNENREKAVANLKKMADEYHAKVQDSEPGSADREENFTQEIRCLSAWSDLTNGIVIRKPDILVQDSLVFRLDSITLELFYFGQFHSKSDLLIYIPELQILFVGDLFGKYGRPSLNYPDSPEKERWQESVQWIRTRINPIEIIITGHGLILEKNDLEAFLSHLKQ